MHYNRLMRLPIKSTQKPINNPGHQSNYQNNTNLQLKLYSQNIADTPACYHCVLHAVIRVVI